MANQERVVEWAGEEDFPNRCRKTTIGNKLLYKHIRSTYGVEYYAEDEYNKRNKGPNDDIVMCQTINNVTTFYCIKLRIIDNRANMFRIQYTMKVETNLERILGRTAEIQKDWIEDLMIESGNPEWIELVRVRREAKEEYLVEMRRLAREQMVRDEERNIIIHQIQAEEHREFLARVQRAQEEDHNDILRQAQEALERAQTELRREREMMAEFVEVFAPEPAIVPHFGAQLDLVPTPVPFVPEEPPNA